MSSEQSTILVIEDDEATRTALARDLRHRGFRVEEAADGVTGLARWEARRPDAIILDLGLPDMEGMHILRVVRREATTPVLVLSVRDDERGKVAALDGGADDYVTKPVGMAELEARLRVALRHAAGPTADAGGRLVAGPLVIDVARHAATVGGRPLELTPREFEILRVLMMHPGRVVTRARLLRAVWGEAYSGDSHYLHVFVSQIRAKLTAADPSGELRDLIITEPGVGYRLRDRGETGPQS